MIKITGEWIDDPNYEDGGYYQEISIPSKFEVCPTCRGKGKTVNPAIDGNGLTREDFDELGEDFTYGYFNGDYDIRCTECEGLRVIEVIDRDRATEEQLKLYDEKEDEEIRYREMKRMEDSMSAWFESGHF